MIKWMTTGVWLTAVAEKWPTSYQAIASFAQLHQMDFLIAMPRCAARDWSCSTVPHKRNAYDSDSPGPNTSCVFCFATYVCDRQRRHCIIGVWFNPSSVYIYRYNVNTFLPSIVYKWKYRARWSKMISEWITSTTRYWIYVTQFDLDETLDDRSSNFYRNARFGHVREIINSAEFCEATRVKDTETGKKEQ